MDDLESMWKELTDALADRKDRLETSEVAQQYLYDAAEAEAWMSEQELYMMGDGRGE